MIFWVSWRIRVFGRSLATLRYISSVHKNSSLRPLALILIATFAWFMLCASLLVTKTAVYGYTNAAADGRIGVALSSVTPGEKCIRMKCVTLHFYVYSTHTYIKNVINLLCPRDSVRFLSSSSGRKGRNHSQTCLDEKLSRFTSAEAKLLKSNGLSEGNYSTGVHSQRMINNIPLLHKKCTYNHYLALHAPQLWADLAWFLRP